MKLLRLGNSGKEIPAAIDKNGRFRNLSSYIKDLNPDTINFEALEKLKKINLEKILDCLKNETNEIIIDKKISDAARKSVLRMTEIGR